MKVLYAMNLSVLLCLLTVLSLGNVHAQEDGAAEANSIADDTEQQYSASYEPAPLLDGSVVRFDIPSEDLEESREFYGEVFGWTFIEDQETNGRYLYWQDPSGMTGGFSQFITPGEGTGVVFYLHSDDIEESFKRISRAGGRPIDFTMEIEGGSARVGLFTDPQGNLVGLISPAQ